MRFPRALTGDIIDIGDFNMTNRALTREDEHTIAYFYHEYGYTQDDLAEMYGVSRTTVRRAIERAANFPQISWVAKESEGGGHDWPGYHAYPDGNGEGGGQSLWFTWASVAAAVAGALYIGFLIWHAHY